MPKLREAIQGGDCATLMSEAHAIKGGTGNFFAKAAFETTNKLEMMGRNENLTDAEATFGALETDIERLQTALADLIRT